AGAAIGAATAVMAGLIACVQTDIKRVLAYSTMSQIGYMFFVVSIGAEVAGIFHLVTHAFFKALLFLAAGNVIHALGGEQDIRRMGGLWQRLPWTGWAFLAGTLALAGVPPLSGFFSKDEIISGGLSQGPMHPLFGLVLVLTAGITGYYMLRVFFVAFTGRPVAGRAPAHEAPFVMLGPVLALALLAVAGGLLQPGPWHVLGDFLRTVAPAAHGGAPAASPLVSAGVLVVVLAGVAIAYSRFGGGLGRKAVPGGEPAGVLGRGFYWDALQEALVVRPLWELAALLDRAFEAPI